MFYNGLAMIKRSDPIGLIIGVVIHFLKNKTQNYVKRNRSKRIL